LIHFYKRVFVTMRLFLAALLPALAFGKIIISFV